MPATRLTPLSRSGKVVIGTVFALTVAAGLATLVWSASTSADVRITPETLDLLGNGRETKSLTLRNVSDRPVLFAGYRSTCACVKISAFPLTLAPKSEAEVPLYADSDVDLTVTVQFITDATYDPDPLIVNVRRK